MTTQAARLQCHFMQCHAIQQLLTAIGCLSISLHDAVIDSIIVIKLFKELYRIVVRPNARS